MKLSSVVNNSSPSSSRWRRPATPVRPLQYFSAGALLFAAVSLTRTHYVEAQTAPAIQLNRTSGVAQLTVSGQPGAQFRIEAADDSPQSWNPLVDSLSPQGSFT